MRSYNALLQTHALYDLTNRAKGGIVMYLLVWLAITLTFNIHNTHPDLFMLNTGILGVFCMVRIGHLVLLRKAGDKNISLLMQSLVFILLATALHWGALCAWFIYQDSLNHLQAIMLIITPAFALGGACTLCISSEIRILYPTLMFTPIVVALLLDQTVENSLLAGLCVVSMLYIFVASRASHHDYWEAITNHMVAEERAESMEKLSITDQLTQLKNRMFFDSEFSREWRRSARLKSPLSIIMIDVDLFKAINDQHGHVFGDQCLQVIAQAINSEAKRPSDCVARYGGEEFVVLLPNTDKDGARALAERMLKAVRQIEITHQGKTIPLSCSIGGATCIPALKTEKTSLVRFADSALYEAKNAGRDQYKSQDDIQS